MILYHKSSPDLVESITVALILDIFSIIEPLFEAELLTLTFVPFIYAVVIVSAKLLSGILLNVPVNNNTEIIKTENN